MISSELPSALQALPSGEQLDIANAILDRLTLAGELPVSNETQEELERRVADFEADASKGQPWEVAYQANREIS